MSKLERLIEKLCPDGVEYKKIGGLLKEKELKLITPSIKLKTNQYLTEGQFPVISQELEYISGYTNLSDNNIPNGEYICFGDHSEHIKFVDFKFVQGADGLKIFKVCSKELDIKYIYYAFCNYYIRHNNYERHTKYLKDTEIPVPPLPIQEEIVRILDSFTELNAELEKELEARKKQYEWYHQKLMDFNNSSLKYVLLGEYFEFKNGLNKEKDAFGNGTPIINFTDVYNHRYLNTNMIKGLVNVSEIEIERYNARKGDVFFTRTSETKDDIGMSSTLIEEIPNCVYSGFILRARPKTDLFLPKFCSYYFSTNQVRKQIIRYASVTTRATTTGPKLSKIRIPLVPKFEQQRIVDILDRFDKLCNDISEGLPAEIDARQKQYEYYRDKLLTFKRLGE